MDDRDGRVEVPADFTSRPAEVEVRRAVLLVDVYLELDLEARASQYYLFNTIESYAGRFGM